LRWCFGQVMWGEPVIFSRLEDLPEEAAIDAQIQAAYDFQAFVDQQFGGPGTGWFRIVTSSAEARSVILQRKLAVVLGIEVDNLFDCKFGQCTADFVRQQLQTYYDKGVRHVFPVHNFDNAYGSPSIFLGAINVGNRVSEGRYFEVEDCGPSGYGFKLVASVMNFFISLFKFGIEPPPIYPDYPHCNLLGLSSLGQELVTEMMNKGMIIDVDHMSLKTLDRVLELAEARSYPVVASHVLFYDLYTPERRHERMRTAAQLDRIRNVGGMVAAMLKDDAQDTDDVGQKFTVQYGNVADDCRYSSKTWAQAYRYAVDKMGGPVAFGSDFNGIAGHLGPRFGSHACGSDALERSTQARAANQLAYPFRDGLFFGYGQFDRQITGQRAFDFNVDGLAHIGLLPDLVADLQRIGLNATDLEPLFQSANAYVEMWGRAEAATPRTPCGGAGQRACCAPERTPSCDPGLDEVPGCSGDCVCAIGGSSVSTCVPSVTTTSAPSSSTTVTLTSSTSTTVTITPPASTTSTSAPSAASTTTTLPACRTLRCLIDAARRGPHCGDETLPPSVTNKLDRAIQMAELAPGQTPKKTKRLYTSARRLLAKAGKAATKAARGSRPKLTAECAADLRDAIARAIGTLGT